MRISGAGPGVQPLVPVRGVVLLRRAPRGADVGVSQVEVEAARGLEHACQVPCGPSCGGNRRGSLNPMG